MKGTIKQLKENYGFIVSNDVKGWIWFSFRGVQNIENAAEGEEVEFELDDGKNGKKSAKNVKLVIKNQNEQAKRISKMPPPVKEERVSDDIKELSTFDKDGKRPHNELFSSNAKEIASKLSKGGNTPTQLRRFYEQVVRYYDDIRFQPTIPLRDEALSRQMPYILMLESRVYEAYSKNKVNKDFKEFIDNCIAQLRSNPNFETLKIFKTLYEAVLGFSK